MKLLKKIYFLMICVITMTASGFTTNNISPGDTLTISSNAIPIGSFINGIELYFDSTNTIAKGQNGYYFDYDDYVITNSAIVLEDWYLQMDLTSFPPVYNVGPAELYPNVNLGPVLATFSLDKINKSTGFNMELTPNWSSSNSTFNASDRFLTSTTPPVFSDNIYFNDFDADDEAEIDYNPTTIPARGSSVEFGLFNEPTLNGDPYEVYDNTVEAEFNFVDASQLGMTNWYDDFQFEVSLRSSKDVDHVSDDASYDQEIGIRFEYNNKSNGTYNVISSDIDAGDLGLSITDLSAADFKFYSSNNFYYVDFLPIGMSNQTDFINLMSWGDDVIGGEYGVTMLITEPHAIEGSTNHVNGYIYETKTLDQFPENFSYYGVKFEASKTWEYFTLNSLGVSYLNVSKDPSSPINVTSDAELSFSFPEGYYERNDGTIWSDDIALVEYPEGITIEGTHGVIPSSVDDFTNTIDYNQVTSGALATGSLTAADNVLDNLLNEYSTWLSDYYGEVGLSAGHINYQDGLLVKEAAINYTVGDISYTGSVVAVLSATDVTVYETWADEDVSSSTRDALFSAASSPSATPAGYVYRFAEPESNEAVDLVWSLDFNTLPNAVSNVFHSLSFHKLDNEKILFTYPYQSHNHNSNGIVVTVIGPSKETIYSSVESYLPFYASNDGASIGNSYLLPKGYYLNDGIFIVYIDRSNESGESIGGYSTLYYPTNNTYEKIVFNSKSLFTETYTYYAFNEDEFNHTAWPQHNDCIYLHDIERTYLSKYRINLPHLNVIDVSDPSAALLALDTRLDSVETNLTQVSSDLAASGAVLSSAFAANDSAVSNAVLNYADSAINSFSNSVDWAGIGSGGSDPSIDNRVSDVESVNALLANSINLEIAQRQAAVSALQDDIIDLQTAMGTMTNNSAGMTIAEAKEMMKDLRPGSTIIDVEDGQATISMHLEESSDLTTNWTERADTLMEVTVPATNNIQFFRFGN